MDLKYLPARLVREQARKKMKPAAPVRAVDPPFAGTAKALAVSVSSVLMEAPSGAKLFRQKSSGFSYLLLIS
jgi:hypothetical protein